MLDTVPVLAIETSGEICGACVYYNENKYFNFNIKLKNSHSEKLFGLIDDVLKAGNINIKDVKCLAVSAGPGSFTGLRIGMAAVKGLSIGQNLPLICVPTFNALAYQISKSVIEGSKFIVVSKTNVEELYYAMYSKENGLPVLVDGLSVISREDIGGLAKDGIILYSNEKFDTLKIEHQVPLPVLEAKIIAEWSYFFGKDLLTYNLDFVEPTYLKEFVIKVKK